MPVTLGTVRVYYRLDDAALIPQLARVTLEPAVAVNAPAADLGITTRRVTLALNESTGYLEAWVLRSDDPALSAPMPYHLVVDAPEYRRTSVIEIVGETDLADVVPEGTDMSPAPLEIQQGTTFALIVKDIRDGAGRVLDPTGWVVRAVARRIPEDDVILAAWSTTPVGTEGLAAVDDPDPLPGETVILGEKWIYLHGTPAMTRAWTWLVAQLDVHVIEPAPLFREAKISKDDTSLILKRTTVY